MKTRLYAATGSATALAAIDKNSNRYQAASITPVNPSAPPWLTSTRSAERSHHILELERAAQAIQANRFQLVNFLSASFRRIRFGPHK